MKIQNAIIITDSASILHMSLDELSDFSGNVVFSRSKLPADVVSVIDYSVGRLSNNDTVSSDPSGTFAND